MTNQQNFPHFSYDIKNGRGVLDAGFEFKTPIVGEVAVLGSTIVLRSDGTLCLLKGYSWDFGSGAIDTPGMIVSSLAHDGFCDLIGAGELCSSYRRVADKYFLQLMKHYGVPFLRRWWCYLAVRGYSIAKGLGS